MSTKFYLQTRGKTIDYRFLYKSPHRDWWRDYAEYILFEDRTIILERLNDENGRLYLSGIPSHKRRDRASTVIRYTLVAEFGKGKSSEILRLVKQFLDDCHKKSNDLGESLDRCFQERDIEDALRYREISNKKRQDQISQKIANLVKSVPKPVSYNQYEEGIWWGGLESNASYEKWLSLAEKILNGEPGVAALLNATSEKSLPFLKEKLTEKKVENAFILLPDKNAKPKQIGDIQKKGSSFGNLIGDLPRQINFPPLQTKVYVRASVLVSALIFLIFILVR